MPQKSPFTPAILKYLGDATGINTEEQWANIFLLTAKSEQDQQSASKVFVTDKGTSLFAYASALSYDRKQRGVTIGLVGFTTACDGKDGQGDAMELFKTYHKLGGEDLAPMTKGCTHDQKCCDALIKKISGLGNDEKWVKAQWMQLMLPGQGYLEQTMKGWKKIGVDKPSPLAVATVWDTSLNQGFDGRDGGVTNLIKLGVHGDEKATLKKFNAWRRTVAGTHDYNSPKSNGEHRADMYAELLAAGCMSLKGCDKEIKKAVSWEMK